MSDVRYFNLSIPAPRRLAMMRADFAQHATRYPRCPENIKPKSWRDVRGWNLKSWRAAFCDGLNPGLNGGAPIWYSHGGEQFRREKFADECEDGPGHSGWYTDAEGREKARGIVIRLSRGRFLAGYHWSSNGERVYFPKIHNSEWRAVCAADDAARDFAELAREDSERFDAMKHAEIAADDARNEARLAYMARNVSGEHREAAREAIEALREALSDLAEKTADYENGGQ